MPRNADGGCSKCDAPIRCIKMYRIPYVGAGDINYIEFTCQRCGHKWEERD